MKRQPLVSIIIVNYNGKKLIQQCLGSLSQMYYQRDRLEVIMVDNNSQDGSVNYVLKTYKDTKVIINPVNSYSQSCNIGINNARGSYIVLLNNDVKVKKDWLSELVKIIESDSLIGAVTSKLLTKNNAIQNTGHVALPDFYWEERGAGKKSSEYSVISEVDSICGACVLYRKKALEQIGLLDEDFLMYGEDVDMSIRLKQKGWKLVFVPSSLAYHKFHGTSNERFARECIEKNRLLLVAKHYPHYLGKALVGSGYFTMSADNIKTGQVFDLMPGVFAKLIKHHPLNIVEQVIRELFPELKKILNLENKLIEDELKKILADLIDTRKHRDSLWGQEENFKKELQAYKEEIVVLSSRLQESLDSLLMKDTALLDKDQALKELSAKIVSSQEKLEDYRDEVKTLSSRLSESFASGLLKDNIVLEKNRDLKNLSANLELLQKELQSYKDEITALTLKLEESLNSGLAKDREIEGLSINLGLLQKELQSYKDEINALTLKLEESLNSGLAKDRDIEGLSINLGLLQKELQSYKDEIGSLSNHLTSTLNQKLELEKKLADIYNSEGFRFILNPLWKSVWYVRKILKSIFKSGRSFIWNSMILLIFTLYFLQMIAVCFERIIEFLFGGFLTGTRQKREIIPFDKLTISIVIPNWNGIDLLKKCLSSIYEADSFRQGSHEVLVVDDASHSSIALAINEEFPSVRVIRNESNQGFGRSCNRGVKEAKGELIVLLNNDIMVSSGFLDPLLAHFKDEQVFAVAPKLYYWDKKTFNYGMHMGEFKGGYINLWNESETGNGDKITQTSPTIFAIGGAMVFRKRDFLWLGGFDDIYRPNCWEDIDLSYRAQKRGLKVLYEPKSIVYHKAGSTLNYHRHKEIKNELLFMWKNINDDRMLLSHFMNLPKFFLRGRHSSSFVFVKGYLWAFTNLSATLINRFREQRYFQVSDKNILDKCRLYYRNFRRNNYTHNAKKTVLLITPFLLYPLNCGGKLRIYNLYQRLYKKYRVVLLSLVHNKNEMVKPAQLEQVFSQIHLIHTKTPPPGLFFPKRYRYSYSRIFIEQLKEILDKEAVDIIHIESNELLYLNKYIKYIPIVYTEHDISILNYAKSYYKKGWADLLFGLADYFRIVTYHWRAYKTIDKVITLSREDIKVVSAFAPQTSRSLIHTGVDAKHFYFSQKDASNKNLMFVGHYPHYPNEEAAIYFCRNILPLIKDSMPDITVTLVGSLPTKEVLELDKIAGVKVTGSVEDVNPFLQKASCFVAAIQSSAGIKGKILEAMSTGTPVVSTTRGAYGIEAVQGKDILIADTPESFAQAVLKILNNPDLYKSMAHNARRLIEEKYNWDNIAGKLDKVYQELSSDNVNSHANTLDILKNRIASPLAGNDIDGLSDNTVNDIIETTKKIVKTAFDYMGKEENTLPLPNPEELHFELTHLCNSRCITCDIWDYHKRNNKSIHDEISLSEIKNLINKSQYLKDIKAVVLSGGEPFLRSDIVDICRFFNKTFPNASLGILTNCINTESIISETKEILANVSRNSFWIGSSLDGLNGAYDRIRGIKGGFSRFQKTVELFRREFPEVKFSATFVINPFNIDQLIPCWEFAQKNNLDFFAQFGVPKIARDKEVFQWRSEDLHKIEVIVNEIIRRIVSKNSEPSAFLNSISQISDKINLLTTIYYWSCLVDFQKTKSRFAYICDAGYKFAMFDPYGNLFFCPLLKEKNIGNIRQNNFDDIWRSKEAKDTQDFIKAGSCSCWLVCTVFPAVGRALAEYGNKAASAQDNAMDISVVSERSNRLIGINNIGLNEEEFRNNKVILQSTPQGLTIGTNYNCNGNCMFCLGGDYKPFSLGLYRDYFEPKLSTMLHNAGHVSFCGMGELLLTPDINDFLNYINERLPDKNKILTTNGLALNEHILNRIIRNKYSIQISLHASNSILHEQLTGIRGGFDIVIRTIKYMAQKRKDRQSPYIVLVFLVNTVNIEDLPNFVDLAASLGVDSIRCNYLTVFKPHHLKLSCFFKQEVTNEMFAIASQKAQKHSISLEIPPKFSSNTNGYTRALCADPWKNIYVDTEGAVLPCCYSGRHFGNLNDDVMQVWNNAEYRQIRGDILSGVATNMCRYCLNNNPANVNLLNSHVSFRAEVQKEIF